MINKTGRLLLLVMLLTGCATNRNFTPRWKTLPELTVMPKADISGLLPVNGIQLYYAIYNQQGKEPVLLLHGGLTSSDYWGMEILLLKKTHKLIIVDSRGHGRSTLSGQPLTYELMASDVLLLMNDLKILKASVVGWSDGGIIGLILAMQHPERIDKLFTFGTNFSRSGEKTEAPDTALAAHFIKQAKGDYSRISPTPNGFPALKKALLKMYGAEPELDTNQIKTITATTVIACGQYEQFYKREHFQALANLIPHAKLVVLRNVSHGGPLQDPSGFHCAVMHLLDGKK